MESSAFLDRGILLAKGLVPRNVAKLAREYLFKELDRLNIRSNGKWQTRHFDQVQTFQIANKIAQKIKPQQVLDAVITPEVQSVINKMAGCVLKMSQPHPSVLITPPQKIPWEIPESGWHVDIKGGVKGLPGIQVFIVLDDLKPKAGATAVLTGSHLLYDSSPNVLQMLRNHEASKHLFVKSASTQENFFKPASVTGIDIQVIELVGSPGDVYFMDMRILHAPSVNSSNSARMAITNRFLRP